MAKRALVISGGGSKGAFAVGVLDYLVRERGLTFDIVAGTSTGALIAPLAVLGDIERLKRLYSTVETRDVLKKRNRLLAVLFKASFFSTEPLRDLIERELTDADAQRLFASATQMFVTTVSLQTGRVVYYATGPIATEAPDTQVTPITSVAMLRRAVFASASQPVLMPAVRIPEDGEQFVDGGVRELEPLKIAILNGATEIYAIVMEPEGPPRRNRLFRSILPTLERTLDLFLDEILLNDLHTAQHYNEAAIFRQRLKDRLMDRFGLTDAEAEALFDLPDRPDPTAGKRIIGLQVIRPKAPLPLDSLTFDPEVMAQMVETGRARAEELLGQPV